MRICAAGLVLASPLWAQEARPVVSELVRPLLQVERGFAGVIAARHETVLGFTVPGTLAERRVSLGDVVQAGEVLALIDPVELEATLRSAEAGVLSARAALDQAQRAEARTVSLYDRGVASTAQVDTARTGRLAAEAGLEQAEASLARARDRRQEAVLRAPEAGVITEVLSEPGATLSVAQPVLRLAAIGALDAVIDLTAAEIAALTPETRFDIALIAAPELATTARVSEIGGSATSTTRTRRVKLALATIPPSFRLGALITATPQSRGSDLIAVPRAALLADGAKPAVWCVTPADRQVQRCSLDLGEDLGDRVVVRSGLVLGQEIVTRGINSLTEGQVVGPQVAK